MSKELELFSAEGVVSFFKRSKHDEFTLTEGQKCLNCDTELVGRFCHVCAQDASSHHRNIFHIIFSGIEGLFHIDARLWRTIPPLFFNPGALAKDYIDGRINRHVPPFRTFLVALLVFIVASEQVAHHLTKEAEHHAEAAAHDLNDPAKIKALGVQMVADAQKDREIALAEAKSNYDEDINTATDEADKAKAKAAYDQQVAKLNEAYSAIVTNPEAAAKARLEREARGPFGLGNHTTKDGLNVNFRVNDEGTPKGDAMKAKLVNALGNPHALMLTMFSWGHRLTALLLPIMTLFLGLMYVYKRRFYLFDHFLVSCNILSFAFFTNGIVLFMPESWRQYGFMLLTVWTPVNMFMTLKGAYGSGWFGALVKTLMLWFMTMFSFSVLIGLIFYVSVITS